MKPFDAEAKCPKCGGDDLATTFHAASDLTHPMAVGRDRCDVHDEHIHRHCRRCGYDWIEAPLDKRDKRIAELEAALRGFAPGMAALADDDDYGTGGPE